MAKSWNRLETWVTLIVFGISGVVMAIFGLNVYMSATAPTLHPTSQTVPSASDAPPAARWATAVDRSREAVRTALSEQNVPGLSVAVGAGGEIVWAEGFGFANSDARTPVTPNTRFRIGTLSIPLTSAAAGLLLERHELELDQEIQAYVPEFPRKQWPVTLRQLMGHTAGVRSDGGDEGPLFSQTCKRPADALPHFADGDLLFEPGTAYRYSRYDWIVVSAAIESAGKRPFLDFMREQIFEPLGMHDTKPDSLTKDIADLATFYFPRFSADPRYGPDLMRPLEYSCYAGSSVFLSNPSDLVRFALAIAGGKLLERETVHLLQTSLRLPSGQETGYGLGWDLEDVALLGAPAGAVGHDGDSLGGNVGSLMTFPDRGLFVAVLSNMAYADTPAVALEVANAFAEAARSDGK